MYSRYRLEDMGALWEDSTLLDFWLKIEIAVARANGAPEWVLNCIKLYSDVDVGVIQDLNSRIDHPMIAFLKSIARNIAEGMRGEDHPQESIDKVLSYIHAGLTSYDVWDTALALRLKAATDYILSDLSALKKILWGLAVRYMHTPQIGRTHLQHAEPITFGLVLLGWYKSFDNHERYLGANREFWQVGKVSGAVGTFTHIEPEVEEEVGVDLEICMARVSSQVVSREGVAYFMSILSNIAGTLAKCAKDIEHLSSTEVGEAFETHPPEKEGSSAMPHKTLREFANANKCERIYSLAKVVRAFSHVGGENIDIRHQQDLTQSASERIAIPGSAILIDYMIDLFTRVVREMRVDEERMMENIWMTGGLVFSGHMVKALTDKGMGREDARTLVTDLCRDTEDRRGKRWLERAAICSSGVRDRLTIEEIRQCFSLKHHLRNVDKVFERFYTSGK